MRHHICSVALVVTLALAASPLSTAQMEGHQHHAAQLATITTVDYAFDAPETLPSGWNTFRFVNGGEEPHFAFLLRLPEGKTVDDYVQLLPAFGRAYEALQAGEVDQEGAIGILMGGLPEWYFGVQSMGGPGFAMPGIASEVSLNLEPGYYVLECYMKTADGGFHIAEGMIRPLIVTEERSQAAPPEAGIRVRLANDGMTVEGDLTPGRHTVAVHWAENPEMGFPHDVNVARLDEDTDVGAVLRWMNWMDADGLTPAAPVKFIGGARPMTTGQTAYFTLDLEPGRYLFVSENTGYQGVLKEVKVKEKSHARQ